MEGVESCAFCRTVFRISKLAANEVASCPECGKPSVRKKSAEHWMLVSYAATLFGTLLLIPAFSSPMLTVSDLQHRTPISLIEGVKTLLERGDVFLALMLGICSGVLPVLKFLSLLLLHAHVLSPSQARFVYEGVKWTGAMGMLDVFFSAVILFAYQMSRVVDIRIELGMYAFAAAVICNILASLFFDPASCRKEQ